MTAPSQVVSTAGFRSINLFELNSSGYPIGGSTLKGQTVYTVSGSSILSGSPATTIAKGQAVSGSVPYYGIQHSGAKVLAINDPIPRVLPHIGDDSILTLQVLPSLEPASGELRVDPTNNIVDAIVGNTKKFTVGEMNMLGSITNQRGFENQVGALAYSFAQDTDPESSDFGATRWDFRIFPKVTIFQRDTGYGQEVNERLYSFTPAFVTSHIWQTAFSTGTEGFTRAQIIRGISTGKPVIVSWKGNGSQKAFSFDTSLPATGTGKIAVWVDGVLEEDSASFSRSIYGLSFAAAPTSGAIITALYEVA